MNTGECHKEVEEGLDPFSPEILKAEDTRWPKSLQKCPIKHIGTWKSNKKKLHNNKKAIIVKI